jgi:LemA protein
MDGSMICLLSVAGLVLMVLLAVALNYNGLVRTRNHVNESWSDIDTELKRRYDLIPNLVETVKGYARHERDVLERVTEARTRAMASTGTPGEQAQEENFLVGALRQIFALSEGYPQLKSDGNFLELQKELTNTEDRIQAARRFYNGNVREMNNRVQMFPSSIIAGMFHFKSGEFFEVEDSGIRRPVDVAFDRG